MNDTTTEPGKALTVQQRASVALGASEHEKKLRELVEHAKGVTAITNAVTYQECHGARMGLKNARVAIEKAGKEARADAVAYSKGVIAEEKRLLEIGGPEELRLQALQDAHDAKIAAEKAAAAKAEAERVARIRSEIDEIRDLGAPPAGLSAERIEKRIALLTGRQIAENFAELKDEAETVRGAALARLREFHGAAVAHEAEQARLKAEREELDRRRAEQEAREAAEAARIEEENRKRAHEEQQRKAQQALEERQARERIEAADLAARLARDEEDRKAREARAADEARARAEQEQRDAARRSEEDRLRAERAELDRKAREIEAREKVERDAREAADRAERDRVEAEARAAREKQEERERTERLAAQAIMDGDEMLRTFRGGYGYLQRYAAVNHAIDLLFTADRERDERQQTAEATA